ncbi:MAG: hypothetical protein XD72_1745 [Methanothrix harundinacea]|jgi:hypothetical protein|uniref:Uncharacterized protein n=1 Tax=Methanothrix harundinacea TaxID=301375 RepID=A0A101IMM0_9EURY|nr:MAG: hypothetical protein XD72_1745 [Methanothrix harundinacea]KUK97665.1 MAG: hypothetical protein XE07_0079 [Methanothrix harundinacea]
MADPWRTLTAAETLVVGWRAAPKAERCPARLGPCWAVVKFGRLVHLLALGR